MHWYHPTLVQLLRGIVFQGTITAKKAVGTFGWNGITQWFPTGMPRHPRVLFTILMGAKN